MPHAALWPALGVSLLVAACSNTGDFGRRADTIVTNSILPQAGTLAAMARSEPVSAYPFTDDERELRDRAWRYLMPAHEAANLQHALAELSYTRVLPAWHHSDRNHYHLLLLSGEFRSVASRYAKLADDIEADHLLLNPFVIVATRVCLADRARLRSLQHVSFLSGAQRDHALYRVEENRFLLAWVQRDWRYRANAFRYALEHLMIEAPQHEAVLAERRLLSLEAVLARYESWDVCGEGLADSRRKLIDKDTAPGFRPRHARPVAAPPAPRPPK
jgi:hypothetical protein